MLNPRRRTARLVTALVVVVVAVLGATTLLESRPGAPSTKVSIASSNRPTTNSCAGGAFTDLQINQCLVRDMTLLQRQMTAAVRFEARYLGVSRRSGFLTQQAQKTFLTYARAECLAEANPYRGGTIYPIIFGECSLSLYRQRLALIVEQTQYLQRGGPAAPSS